MSFKALLKGIFGGKADLARDVSNADAHAVERKAQEIHARMLGQGFSLDVEVLIPSYNTGDYGGDGRIVDPHYTSIIHGLGYLDRLALMKDSKKRGAVSLRIVPPHGVSLDKEDANSLFDAFASAEDEGYVVS